MAFIKQIPESDRIPLIQKIAIGLGQKTDTYAVGIMASTLWMPFFNIGLGLSPITLAGILMVLRAWDGICDPVVGNLSDNARTRWGRRRPFMFVAAITTACIYPFIWNIPTSVLEGTSWLTNVANWMPIISGDNFTMGERTTTLYLILIGFLFFTSITFYTMPYYGLQLELTPNYDERTRLNAVVALIGKLNSVITGWIFGIIVFIGALAQGDLTSIAGKPEWIQNIFNTVQPWLASVSPSSPDDNPLVTGMRISSWGIALLILCLGITPAILVKERFYEKESSKQAKDPFWKSIKESLRCRPLWILILATFFLALGNNAVGSLGQYVNIYYVCNGDMLLAGKVAGLKGTVLAVSGVLMLPFLTWLGEKLDKRTVVILMLSTCMFGHFLNIILMTPENPYLQIISGFFEAIAIGAFWMFIPSMKADVADWDELTTHRRREGSINAFYSWFLKVATTASTGISGIVLVWSGYNTDLPQQPDEVLGNMLNTFVIVPVIIWAFSLGIMWFYPITRARSTELRATLEQRRGKL